MAKPTYEELERELELRRELDELRAGREERHSLPTSGRYGVDVNIGQARKGKGKILFAYAMYFGALFVAFSGIEIAVQLALGMAGIGYFVQEFGRLQRWWHWD